MLAVHGLWSPGRGVLLWAEDGDRPATSAQPLAALGPAAPVRRAGRGAGRRCTPASRPRSRCCCRPGRAARCASPELVRAAGPRGPPAPPPCCGRGRCRRWLVDASELADPADEVRYGASVAHLRAVAALADDLAARGRVLPTLDRAGDAALARWRPVVQGSTASRWTPWSARCPRSGGPSSRPASPGAPTLGADPQVLVDDALAVLTDAAVRDRLARAAEPITLLPPRRGRSPRPGHRPPRPGWPRCSPRTPGSAAPAAWRRASWTRWPTRSPAGTRSARRPTGDGRASFRLSEVRTLHDPADPAPTRTTRPATAPSSCWSSSCSPRADPSLLVPAAQVWDGRAEPAARRAAGAAARPSSAGPRRVYPPLAPALRAGPPGRARTGARRRPRVPHRRGAPLLVEAGFGVQLPAGWDGSRRVGLTLSARSTPADRVLTRSGLGREKLADFRWSVAVGDEELSARRSWPSWWRPRRRWCGCAAAGSASTPQRLAAGLEFLRRGAARARAARPRPRCSRWPSATPTTGPPTTRSRSRSPRCTPRAGSATCWPARSTGRSRRSSRPAGFHAQLRPYQQRGRVLAGLPVRARAGRLPGRRHGPGQDRAAAGPGGLRAGRRPRRARRC